MQLFCPAEPRGKCTSRSAGRLRPLHQTAPGHPLVAMCHVPRALGLGHFIPRKGTYLRLDLRPLHPQASETHSPGPRSRWGPLSPAQAGWGRNPSRYTVAAAAPWGSKAQTCNRARPPAGTSRRLRAVSVPRAAPGRARPPAPRAAKRYSTPRFWPPGAEELRAGKA